MSKQTAFLCDQWCAQQHQHVTEKGEALQQKHILLSRNHGKINPSECQNTNRTSCTSCTLVGPGEEAEKEEGLKSHSKAGQSAIPSLSQKCSQVAFVTKLPVQL